MSSDAKKARAKREGTHWTSKGLNRTKARREPTDVSHEQLQKEIAEGHRHFWASRGMSITTLRAEFVPRY